MAKKQAKKKARRKTHRSFPETSARASWVDRVSFDSNGEQTVPDDGTLSLSLISWNILAHSYCSRTSQRGLPAEYQKIVFHGSRRRQRIMEILERLVSEEADILCLQEVDMVEVSDALRKLGWEGIETPRQKNGGGSGTRVDSCVVFVDPEHWRIKEHQVVEYDDLASLLSHPTSGTPGANRLSNLALTNLQGLKQSFLRRNVGLLVRLEDVHTGQTFVLANTHLFWNPNYEYIKFCQIHYLQLKARDFCNDHETFVLCGDLNSKPRGAVYNYLSTGHFDARRVAPWNGHSGDAMSENDEDTDTVDKMANLTIDSRAASSDDNKPTIRYLLDFTLNKLCRWLRILGIDTALESEEEERARTKQGKMILFERARAEGRALVTTSTRLMQRSDCPPGTYLISPQSLPNLEVTLVHLLLTHGVALDPTSFLTRCVVCNGHIASVEHVDHKERILKTYDAPTEGVEDMDVFECEGCQQGYWWSDRPNSSASRIKGTTTNLFELCLQAGVPLHDENELGFFDYVNVEAQRSKGWDNGRKGSEILRQDLQVLEWLKNQDLRSPFGAFASAYAYAGGDEEASDGESLPFTNVTDDFVDVLDYIWYDPRKLKLDSLLWVPQSFVVLNESKLPNGHVLPSDVFPSDHLAIGARLLFNHAAAIKSDWARDTSDTKVNVESLSTGLPKPISSPQDIMQTLTFANATHSPRCDCGCVPAIPSLFEMAELRRQARLKKMNGA